MTTTREAALELTPQQKLEALSLRFYQGLAWEPKAGDHYTTSRADLELYQVVSVEDGVVKTRYCNNKTTAISEWKQDGFLSAGFGTKRVWVPDFVLSMKPVALSTPATEPQGLAHIVDYTNWRGETARRVIRPIRMWWGKTEWHPEEQWMLTAWDCEKNAVRDFAWQDMRPVQNPATSAAALAARPAPQPAAEALTRVSLADLEGYGSTTQPAADTRVVDQEWMPIETAPRDGTWFRAKTMGSPGFEQIRLVHFADKYDRLPINGEDVMWTRLPTHWQPLSASAIIDNATPAPSDKIAEAARVLLDDLSAALGTDGGEYCRASARRWSVASDAAEAAPTAMYRPTPIQMIRAALRALAGKGE